MGFNLTGKTHGFYYRDEDRNIREWGFDIQIQKVFTSYFRMATLLGWKRSYQVTTSQSPTVNLFRLEPLYDTRDNLFNPQRGVYSIVRLDRAGGILGGNSDFYRISFDFSRYKRVTKGGYILAFHIGFGDIRPYGRSESVLVSEQFMLGGPGSIRGYGRDEIGPNIYNGVHSGTKLLIGNIEVRKKLTRTFGFVVFLDGGSLSNSWDISALKENRALSGGMGLRVFTPIGPISVDWGLKLVDRPKGDMGKIILFFGQMF